MVTDWTPEPPRECEEVSFNSSNIAPFGLSGSDSDEDNFLQPNGYEPLTNMPIDGSDNDATDSDSETGDEEQLDNHESLEANLSLRDVPSQSAPSDESNNTSQLWSGPARDIVLGAEGAAAVRSAMEGFTLPPGAVPAWASAIPEEQWTDILRQRIAAIQHH